MILARTIYRKTFVRILVFPLVLLAILYTAHFSTDLFIPAVTTQGDIDRAKAYLTAEGLETPDREFVRDGCTLWPDKLPGHDFNEVCLTHDIAYWAGGDSERQKNANLEFKESIEQTGPLGFVLAPIMYAAVAYLGNNGVSRVVSSHWGFGWN